MDTKYIAQTIKQSVSALQAGERIGLRPDRQGYCKCPFHTEKTGSLRLYDGQRGFHCFGCGAGGSVIDLYMKYFDLTFQQAIVKIDSDFGLGLPLIHRMTRKAEKAARFRQELEQMRRETDAELDKAILEAYWTACDLVNVFDRMIRENRPEGPKNGWNEDFCTGLRCITEAREIADDLAVQIIGVKTP